MTFLDERKRRYYPKALIFSILSVANLLADRPDYRMEHDWRVIYASTAVAQHLLSRDLITGDFLQLLEYRHRLEAGSAYAPLSRNIC